MEQKTSRRKKFLVPRVLGTKDGGASPRRSTECSINSTESRSLKFSGFSSPATTSSTHIEAFRVFAATWNVAGKTLDKDLNLNDFLTSDDYSDIYVLGFQEVVPLNAGNVLVIEDNEPAARWLALINQALNRPSPSDAPAFSQASVSLSFPSTAASASPVSAPATPSSSPLDPSLFYKSSIREVWRAVITHGCRLKSCTCPSERPWRPSFRVPCLMMGCGGKEAQAGVEGNAMMSDKEDVTVVAYEASAANSGSFLGSGAKDPSAAAGRRERYCLVACKQMVGLFATAWVRRELVPHVGHIRFSCVGRGIMGYLGNKGCISVSMSLHQTSMCFVCSHLASGEKEGDELSEEFRCGRDPQEHAVPPALQEVGAQDSREDP